MNINELLANFHRVARENGMSEAEAYQFSVFMDARFRRERDETYVKEWVGRIQNKTAWSVADEQTKAALLSIYGEDIINYAEEDLE